MIAWDNGTWSHAPLDIDVGTTLSATAVKGSDAWRHTAYGFVRDDAHALLAPLHVGEAMEVGIRAPWTGQFDQAGLLVREDDEHWVKTGLEFADGHLGLGAVVTHSVSDWSTGFVDEWLEQEITVRVSRWADCLIIRARTEDDNWRLVRVAPFATQDPVTAGPYFAAPVSDGFRVTFTRWERTPADEKLH